ncbi:hypothetical protein SAMN04487895_102324 [Paenibacillus sophorae]|uniref:Uncharacterized protein n=1 Tax=Paenibacillus sophorae TaxID=1333845 RepID=A0A1H8IUU4_9BACL|nr:hypothetical protein [Paenibacillus sophorae]QWU16075.1 hypothetical protein KP014_02010 [Paenibacillus sophorae]SEN71786.1 hypothetical protein SAMN04487895_102324 [Paenibacillus sophorae]
MNENINEQELIRFIAGKTKADPKAIALILKHEQTFINSAKANVKGEVDIDSDDLVDYVLSRRDVKLDELTVEGILDAEMDYLMDKGLAGYLD